jgi:hypothetical protein
MYRKSFHSLLAFQLLILSIVLPQEIQANWINRCTTHLSLNNLTHIHATPSTELQWRNLRGADLELLESVKFWFSE